MPPNVWFVLFCVCLVLFTLSVGLSNKSVEWLALSWLRRLLLLLEGQRRYLEKIIWPTTTTRWKLSTYETKLWIRREGGRRRRRRRQWHWILILSLLAKKVGQRKRIVESTKQVGKAQTPAATDGLILALATVQQDESDGGGQQQQGNLRKTKYTLWENYRPGARESGSDSITSFKNYASGWLFSLFGNVFPLHSAAAVPFFYYFIY